MKKMKILVIGGGGREHALAWKINQSPLVEKIYCAPGNPGISELAECEDIKQTDIPALLAFAKKKNIDLTVVGPEDPLCAGIVDEFESQGLKIFGPSKKAAEIEGSKAFTKLLLDKYKIPTAEFLIATDYGEAFAAAQSISQDHGWPVVVKFDGLAAGKGAFVCKAPSEILPVLDLIFKEKKFGSGDIKVVVERFMIGEEASILTITDGEGLVLLPSSQDHKALYDGDKGPNTGGTGAYGPAPVIDKEMQKRITKEILYPTVIGMAKEGRPYKGLLYAGLMVTKDGPKVVEFNCRFGDPEAQAVLPLIDGDLVKAMWQVASHEDLTTKLEYNNKWAMCVVMMTEGYPGDYKENLGRQVAGLDSPVLQNPSFQVFHAGTKLDKSGNVVNSGGRVLSVTAVADSFRAVQSVTYKGVEQIEFDGAYYRRDIGKNAERHLYE